MYLKPQCTGQHRAFHSYVTLQGLGLPGKAAPAQYKDNLAWSALHLAEVDVFKGCIYVASSQAHCGVGQKTFHGGVGSEFGHVVECTDGLLGCCEGHNAGDKHGICTHISATEPV